MSDASNAILEHRREQIFPVFTPAQVESARRFGGKPREFKPGEMAYAMAEANAPAYLVLQGSIEVISRDGLGHETVVTTHAAGQFSGEIGQLSGNPTLAQGRAGPQGCTVVPFNESQLRALLIGSAEIGEMLMRAYILRRVALFETGAGLILLGAADTPHAMRLQNFLRRNSVPHTVVDPKTDADAVQLIQRLGITEAELPLAIAPDGTLLRRPTESSIAHRVGLLPDLDPNRIFDLAVVGAGPAGLAAAVYAASEGLSVLVLDARALGGQAGASARIENYLGFPTGISGQALMGRAFVQAEKFGAVVAIPAEIVQLECGGKKAPKRLQLDNDRSVQAKTVLVASGARYRQPNLSNLSQFEGRGIYYWASPLEARLCSGCEVVLVGGGNSAGQAAAFLATQVSKVHLLIRGANLEASMSRYLIDRLKALPNLEMHTETEITQLIPNADGGLKAVRWKHRRTGQEEERDIQYIFLFIGADPNSNWLERCDVARDSKGFVKTGGNAAAPFETSQCGVFAVGDVRSGSVKRVASAVGEGSAVVAQIHAYLASWPASL